MKCFIPVFAKIVESMITLKTKKQNFEYYKQPLPLRLEQAIDQ